ncbi:GNAT family N-acetyltransferase [Nonomuraea sp. NPDC059007]|uniref:GNAT family N-acetyltransferase n=1 Tax=Nonomuraea sp. NPDC059007 TaxID=3346692 RepID=UPI00368ADD4D
MSITWGPLRKDDAGRWAELTAAIQAVDQDGENYGAEDLTESLTSPLVDLAEGTLAARDGDRLVAFAFLPIRQTAPEVHRMGLWAGVHPEHRRTGLGTRVLDWAVEAAPRLHERAYPGRPLELQLHSRDTQVWAAKLFESRGFAQARWFFQMERDLATEIESRPPAAGLRLTTWTPDRDAGALNVRNEAFSGHWGTTPHTPASWKEKITCTRAFVPEGSFLALDGDEVVGILITHYFAADTAVTGVREAWIQIIGTLAPWRGKGVASALISHALTELRSQGYGRAGLSVDADNGTGALGVYERSGFTVVQRTSAYTRMLTPA